jgi:hypothetical protein
MINVHSEEGIGVVHESDEIPEDFDEDDYGNLD